MDIKNLLNKQKRERFNKTQLKLLNDIFIITRYPSTKLRIQIANELNVSQRKVQIWFANKRNKR